MLKVYLAGPDVFRKDAVEHAQWKKDICKHYHLIGLAPLDNDVSFEDKTKEEVSEEIFLKNLSLMTAADVGIFNLSAFRGFECDSGTVFELGYMWAKGKPCVAYIGDYPCSYKDRMQGLTHVENGVMRDYNDCSVEDFGGQLNLMLQNSLNGIFKTFEECCEFVEERYGKQTIYSNHRH